MLAPLKKHWELYSGRLLLIVMRVGFYNQDSPFKAKI
jgi:hypothetical protein